MVVHSQTVAGHSHRCRTYSSRGAGLCFWRGYWSREFAHFAVTIDNYGKTPAFIGTIWAKIVPEDELPDTPVYDPPEFGWFGGQMLKPQTSGHPTVVRLWDVVERRVIYGRIWYRDIFKQCHSAGFILRIRGPGQTIAVANRDAYWEDRAERDLGPAARDPAAVS